MEDGIDADLRGRGLNEKDYENRRNSKRLIRNSNPEQRKTVEEGHGRWEKCFKLK